MEMKERHSCSGCLEQILQTEPEQHSKEWESIGRKLPQCELCKAALKDKMYNQPPRPRIKLV